jgi:hypothetical protein
MRTHVIYAALRVETADDVTDVGAAAIAEDRLQRVERFAGAMTSPDPTALELALRERWQHDTRDEAASADVRPDHLGRMVTDPEYRAAETERARMEVGR